MKKNVLVIVLATILAIMSLAETINYAVLEANREETKRSVSQYRFEDGYTITVDWSGYGVAELDGVQYYYGCINDGMEIYFYMWPAHIWERELQEHSDGEDSAKYCAVLTEWRW